MSSSYDWLLKKHKRCKLCGLRLAVPQPTLMAYCPQCSKKQHAEMKQIFAGVDEEIETRRAALNKELNIPMNKEPKDPADTGFVLGIIIGIIFGGIVGLSLGKIIGSNSNGVGVHGRPVEVERRTERLPQGRGEDF